MRETEGWRAARPPARQHRYPFERPPPEGRPVVLGQPPPLPCPFPPLRIFIRFTSDRARFSRNRTFEE